MTAVLLCPTLLTAISPVPSKHRVDSKYQCSDQFSCCAVATMSCPKPCKPAWLIGFLGPLKKDDPCNANWEKGSILPPLPEAFVYSSLSSVSLHSTCTLCQSGALERPPYRPAWATHPRPVAKLTCYVTRRSSNETRGCSCPACPPRHTSRPKCCSPVKTGT